MRRIAALWPVVLGAATILGNACNQEPKVTEKRSNAVTTPTGTTTTTSTTGVATASGTTAPGASTTGGAAPTTGGDPTTGGTTTGTGSEPSLPIEVAPPIEAGGGNGGFDVDVTPLAKSFEGVTGARILNDAVGIQAKSGDKLLAYPELSAPIAVKAIIQKGDVDLDDVALLVVVSEGGEEQRLVIDKRHLIFTELADGTIQIDAGIKLPAFSVVAAEIQGGTLPAGFEAFDPIGETVGVGVFKENVAAAERVGAFTITGPKVAVNAAQPVVTWQRSAGATSYDLVVSTDYECKTPVHSQTGITELSAAITASLSDSGVYYVCVRAQSSAGLKARSALNNEMTLTIDRVPPAAFTITGPLTPTKTLAPQVSWTRPVDARLFRIVVDTEANCTEPFVQVYDDNSTASQPLTTLTAGIYYVCVWARDELGNAAKAANAPYTLTVDDLPPDQPSEPTSKNGSVVGLSMLEFQWAATADNGGSGVASYNLRVGTTAGGNNVFQGNVGNVTTKTIAAIVDGVNYHASIQAVDALGNTSLWSPSSAAVMADGSPPSGYALVAKVGGRGMLYLELDFPASTADFARIELLRATGTTAPACDQAEKKFLTITSFSDQTHLDIIGEAVTVSFRACAYDSAGNRSDVKAEGVVVEMATRIFTTNSAYNGAFGGLSGADTICNSHAMTAGLPGSWKAMLTTNNASPAARVSLGSQIKDLTGALIANVTAGVPSSTALAAPNRNENGVVLSNRKVHIGSNGRSCGSWSSNLATSDSTYGLSAQVSSWLSSSFEDCSLLKSLYCVSPAPPEVLSDAEVTFPLNDDPRVTITYVPGIHTNAKRIEIRRQLDNTDDCSDPTTVAATLTYPYTTGDWVDTDAEPSWIYRLCVYGPADALLETRLATPNFLVGDRRIFIRNSTLSGSNMGSTATSSCTTAASSAGLGGSWTNLRTSPTAIFDPNFPGRLVNLWGHVVLDEEDDYGGAARTAVRYDQLSNISTGKIWVGADAGTGNLVSCNNWNSINAAHRGVVGDPSDATKWLSDGTPLVCNTNQRFYCIEQ